MLIKDFSKIKNTCWTYIDNNQLEEIDEDLFAVQKAELNRVYIRNNRLTNIPKHLFRNMDSLNDLRLTGNLLHEIDPLAFESECL